MGGGSRAALGLNRRSDGLIGMAYKPCPEGLTRVAVPSEHACTAAEKMHPEVVDLEDSAYGRTHDLHRVPLSDCFALYHLDAYFLNPVPGY